MGEPKNYRAIMLSSTFTDLSEHRQGAIEAISKLDYMPKVMEHTGARADDDVIESSLNMVRDSTAYVGVISLKYGQRCSIRIEIRVDFPLLNLNSMKRCNSTGPSCYSSWAMNIPTPEGVGRHRPPPTGYIMKPCRWLDFVSPIRANSRRIKPAKDA